MTTTGDQAIKKVAEGAGIVFLGLIFGKGMAYVYRLVVARYLGPAEYGLLSLGIAILSMLAVFCVMGLPSGVLRHIPFYKGREEIGKVKGVLSFSIKVTVFTGILAAILLFIFSDWIALNVFHNPNLADILRVFSVATPFFALSKIFLAGIGGFQTMKYKTYSEDIIPKIVLVVLTFFLIYLGYGLFGASIAYVLAIISTFLASFYFLNKLFPFFNKIKSISIRKELLAFSFPLLLATILVTFIGHLDTLMLGYFKTAEQVGIYNAAFPTAMMITLVLGSFAMIFTSVSSELYSKNKMTEISKLYNTVTRWIYAFSLPLFLLVVIFSVPVMRILFGNEYINGATPLAILAFGYLFVSVVGPTFQLLRTLGKTKIILLNNLGVVFLDFALNYFLIPPYGITGAAVATTISLIVLNLVSLFEVYYYTKIQPYDFSYIKPTAAALIAISLVYLIKQFVTHYPIYIMFIMLVMFFVAYFLALLLMRGFDREDIMIMLALEKKLGLDLKFFKRIIKRFLY